MMENSDPANNDDWVDKGYVITNASDKGLNFNIAPNDWANCYYKWNAIDPPTSSPTTVSTGSSTVLGTRVSQQCRLMPLPECP